MTCRNCVWLEVSLNATGKRVLYRKWVYSCNAPIDLSLFPKSITDHYSFPRSGKFPRRHMAPEDGEGCPIYSPIKQTECEKT